MPTFWQYSTLFNFKKYETNKLACFDPFWVSNSETSTKYFRIIFSNWINRTSLVSHPLIMINLIKNLLDQPYLNWFFVGDIKKHLVGWTLKAIFCATINLTNNKSESITPNNSILVLWNKFSLIWLFNF